MPVFAQPWIGFILTCLVWLMVCRTLALADDLTVSCQPYQTGDFYASAVLPVEGQPVALTVEPRASSAAGEVSAHLQILNDSGRAVEDTTLKLSPHEGRLRGQFTWTPRLNGMYRAVVTLGAESRKAELLLPVISPKRQVHFVWYAVAPHLRWATMTTVISARKDESSEAAIRRLKARGVAPMAYGGVPSAFDGKGQQVKSFQELEEEAFQYYSRPLTEGLAGLGIDEFGGYPSTPDNEATAAVLRGLIRAREATPGRVFAAWNAGPVMPERIGLYRQAADFLLLETYVFKYIPEGIGLENIYPILDERSNSTRFAEILNPDSGNHCTTLHSLDTAALNQDTGEIEQVIRYIRQKTPEMRGLSFFGTGKPESIEIKAEAVAFRYFVPPVVTFLEGSLWVQHDNRGTNLVAAISNIGAMDAKNVRVAFYDNGKRLGTTTAAHIPVGPHRNANRALLAFAWIPAPGVHRLEARIDSAPKCTVLNPIAALAVFESKPEKAAR
ncbi:MAG: hypothetical protein IT210_16960 [Armatimonadetes bacterium]|nr:hypothetical protein [Armatimonadota bacterium]